MEDPRHSPTVGSWGGAVSYERGHPVAVLRISDTRLIRASVLLTRILGELTGHLELECSCFLQGYLARKKEPPPKWTTVGPWA